MRKTRFILVASLAVLGAVFAFARLALGPANNSVVYLQHKATSQFVAAGATASALGTPFTIVNQGDEADGFHSDAHVFSDPGHTYTYVRFKYADGSFVKVGSTSVTTGSGYHKWVIEEREGGWVIRAIYVPEQVAYSAQGKYLVATENGKLVLTDEESDDIYWDFVSEADYEVLKVEIEKALAEEEAQKAAALKAAKAAVMPGDDATFAVANGQFDEGSAGWTVKQGKIELKGSSDNPVITAYNYVFDVNQTITDLKPGVYKVQVQAFSRPTSNQGSLDLRDEGTELENYCYLYANDEEVLVKQIIDEYLEEAGAGTWSSHEVGETTIYLPNNGSAFSDAFTRGLYENELTVEVGEDEVLTIGVKNTKAPTNQGDAYCGYDNFRLTFVDFSESAKEAYAAIAKKAKATIGLQDPMNANVKAALEAAYTTYGKNYADVLTATKKLQDAVDDAVASIVAYKGIEACYLSNKSFLTEDQAAELDANADVQAILQGLEDGTIEGDGVAEMETIVRACELAKIPYVAEELDVVEVSAQCEYTADYQPGAAHGITIDWDAIAETLDIEKDNLKVYAVLPDGTLDENFTVGSKGTDGWRDAEGNWVNWGTDARFYVQFNEDLTIRGIGKMNTDEVATYTAEFKIVNADDVDGDWVTLKVTLNVVEPEPAATIDELNSTTATTQDIALNIGVGYAGATATVDLSSILATLDVESLDDVTIYAVQSDGTLDKNYKLGTTDGWRDANGDWASWGNEASQFYVKADFARAENQLYEIGAHPDHKGAHLTGPVTYTAKYAFVTAGNDAVILSFNLVVDYEDATLAEGKYYLYNEEAGRYWGAANDWGTRASLVEHPEFVTLIPQEDGTYQLESQVSNGGTSYYFGGDYMDGSPVALTIKDLGAGKYLIRNGATVYGYDGTSTILGKGVEGDAAKWTILTPDEMLAKLATATVETPQDATFLISDPNFGRNNRYSGDWTFEASNKNISGGNNVNNNAESYHSVFTLSQTLDEVPNGVYALSAQGFYRQDGSDTENLPYFFLNDGTVTFPVKTGSENSMSNASVSFTNGLYTVEPIIVKVEDGTITLGAKLEVNTNLWCIWDNFVLTYYGADATLDQVAAQANVAAYKAALAAAEAIDQEAAMPAATLAALQTALNDYANVLAGEYTAETLTAATDALKAATQAANNGIANAEAIAAMKALVDNTNVYTAEALEAFQAYFDKYEAGELTEIVVNPDKVQGWRSANIYDDFLLSAWSIGGNKCTDFNTSLYINTWSVEADDKENGSEMHVPFFEYWTGDANSLDANNLVATVTDLTAGTYDVEALVRVRIKNGVDEEPYGITLNVNDGEAVDVAAGETCDDGAQFRYGTYTATGVVGEDGVLTITFNVAEDNNVSWLSFKNVYYTKQAGQELATVGVQVDINYADGDYYPGSTDATIDVATVLEKLGAESLADVTVYAVQSDGTLDPNFKLGTTDGWRDANGDWTTWATADNMVCVKLDDALNITFIGGMNFRNNMETDDDLALTATYKAVKTGDEDGDWVTIKVTLNVAHGDEEPAPLTDFAQLNYDATLPVNVSFNIGDHYNNGSNTSTTVDIVGICAVLGVESIDEVTVYAIQSDGTLDKNYKLGTTDGWRDANGDWASWGNEASQFFVKADFARAENQLYSVGAHPDHKGAHLTDPTTYSCRYAFVVGDTPEDNNAVILKVNLVFSAEAETKGATGINGILAGQKVEGIFNAQGQKINELQKGLNIVNGKKVYVK